jgi:hypothetical protein
MQFVDFGILGGFPGSVWYHSHQGAISLDHEENILSDERTDKRTDGKLIY